MMSSFGNFAYSKLCVPFEKNPKKYAPPSVGDLHHVLRFITYAWFLSIALTACAMISACLSADRHRTYVVSRSVHAWISITGYNRSDALGFVVVWTAITCIAVSIGGTVVMRKFQTAFAIGAFLGMVIVVANQCLILAVVFGIENRMVTTYDADVAFVVFMVFLCAVYAFFATLLAVFRNSLVKVAPRRSTAMKEQARGEAESARQSGVVEQEQDPAGDLVL